MTDADRLRQSIFITGIHRSGTSWVGRILAAGKDFVIKDEEIFNPTDAGFRIKGHHQIRKQNKVGVVLERHRTLWQSHGQ